VPGEVIEDLPSPWLDAEGAGRRGGPVESIHDLSVDSTASQMASQPQPSGPAPAINTEMSRRLSLYKRYDTFL